jgi:hypothetical protein
VAPRPPQTLESVISDLRRDRERLSTEPYRFGAPHFNLGVVAEDGVFRVRRLEYDRAEGDAYREKALAGGGSFLPEHAEMFMKPTGPVLLEAPTLDALLEKLKGGPWPLA